MYPLLRSASVPSARQTAVRQTIDTHMNLNPIIFALRHPITVMVAMVGIVVGSILAVTRMNVDIFPVMNLPVLYVAQPYGGMDPAQMEGLLTAYYEDYFLRLAGIHHIESKNIQSVAVIKLFFH